MAIEQIRGYIAEHKIGTVIAGTAIVLGIGAAGLNGCSNDPERTEFDGPSQEEVAGYCDTDGWALDEYKAKIGDNATLPLESLLGNDVPAIREEAAKDIARNDFGLAASSVLIENAEQPLDFNQLQGRVETTLEVITSDDKKRQEVCEDVVGQFVRKGDRVSTEAAEYIEVGALYDGKDLDVNSVNFNGNSVNPNDGKVSGFFVKVDSGKTQAVITEDGRLAIPKTVGTEQNPTTLDPNGEPQVTFEDGKTKVEAKLLPDGTVEYRTTNKETGEVSVEIGPNQGNANTGGSAGPNGTNPEAGPNGDTPSPANGGGGTTTTGPNNPGGGTTTTTWTLPPPASTTTQPPRPTTTTTTQPPRPTTTTTTPPWKPPIEGCDPAFEVCETALADTTTLQSSKKAINDALSVKSF